ncbi:sigma-70 family RNA polymerase sigma factor [Sphingobacterium sp.]|uniref:RNA polymerase sigma factor n=1 Tax=Sphingobacterium sp. TaxID=341027 RepID=UPI0028977B2E|nr:sigma-70 family RNA polymerase sigma factor [Sphingobacterium sp.]
MKDSNPADHSLIEQLRAGDQIAFTKLYEMYSPILLQRLDSLLPDQDIILEIHQTAFIRIWSYRENIRSESGIWPLLYRIARNLVIDYYRESSTNEAIKQALMTQATLFYELEEIDDSTRELTERLYSAIDRLPEKRKAIFLLCKFQGKSYEETAKLHGISIGTVKDHMAKAMRFLKQELGPKMYSLLLSLLSFYMG